MEDNPRPVAVIGISDNSNEDNWGYAIGHARAAVIEAAAEAGISESSLTISVEVNGRIVIGVGSDGQAFEAWVVTDRRIPASSFGERLDPTGYVRPRFATKGNPS